MTLAILMIFRIGVCYAVAEHAYCEPSLSLNVMDYRDVIGYRDLLDYRDGIEGIESNTEDGDDEDVKNDGGTLFFKLNSV